MDRHPELWDAARGGKRRVTVDKSPIDKLYSDFVGALARRYPLARVLDSSPFDRSMRPLANCRAPALTPYHVLAQSA